MNWRFGEAGWRLLPGAIATILTAGLLSFGLLEPLEQVGYSTLFRLRGERNWDDRVVLVAIDDSSIKQLGRFPWARTRYVELLDRLTQAKASVVAIDLLFSESSPNDAEFAQAMQRSRRVVLAQAEDETRQPLLPVPELKAAAIATGHIRIWADSDGMTRSIFPQIKGDLAFGIATVAAYSMLQEAIPTPSDLGQPIWLNWVGRAEKIPQYSFSRVLNGEVPDSAFRDKIVVVGVTAAGIDAASTPFDRNPLANGVHLQATLMNNALQSNPLHPIRHPVVILLIFAIGGIGFSVLLSFYRTGIQVAIASLVIVGWIGGSVIALNAQYLLPLALPVGLIVNSTIATALIERSRMNIALKRQVDQLKQRYDSTLVTRPVTEATSMRDITQLMTLADQLGQAQSNQLEIARSLAMGVIAADLAGKVWFCNPISVDLLNVAIEDSLESILVPEWLSSQDWRNFLDQTRAIVVEKLYQQKWFCLRIEPLSVQKDGILVSLEDITIRKAIELNLGDQIEELNQLSELKDEFLSTVSHELRTPITNMKMAIQLLKIARTESQKEHYLRILENECNRESNLVNGLLDLQRLESGRQPLQLDAIELQIWLPELLDPFYRRTDSRQQDFNLIIDPSLPTFYSDRAALERILVELINNACKYTPPNEQIVVTVEWIAPWVEFRVENSGVEIPTEAREKIFDRFYRIPNADPWKQGGSGLGLALVKRLVESLKGTIELSCELDWTIFTVRFENQSGS
ncbi:MAG: CHASE2 domain-containing protein [Leptolyngbya sp. Prado105]|jgi:signal transduction histidine kinase|nr:CHASE2 domain-containing protein [Leptolyngbya sp. Prado105]